MSGSETVREHNLGGAQEVQRARVDVVQQRQRLRGFARQGLRKVHQQQLGDQEGQHEQQVAGTSRQIL